MGHGLTGMYMFLCSNTPLVQIPTGCCQSCTLWAHTSSQPEHHAHNDVWWGHHTQWAPTVCNVWCKAPTGSAPFGQVGRVCHGVCEILKCTWYVSACACLSVHMSVHVQSVPSHHYPCSSVLGGPPNVSPLSSPNLLATMTRHVQGGNVQQRGHHNTTRNLDVAFDFGAGSGGGMHLQSKRASHAGG